MKKFIYFLILPAFIFGLISLVKLSYPVKPHSEIQRIETSTFADVILIPNDQIQDTIVYLVFPSGEVQNTFEQGLAHYVEHLAWLSVFMGDETERANHSNAWTNHFSTGYWQKTTGDKLHQTLRRLILVSDPLTLDTGFALEERDIVIREYDFRVAERVLYSIFREMDQAVYGNAALARSVIGTPDVIAEYALDTAYVLHNQSHRLSDATLLVYGNIRKDRLESALSNLPSNTLPDQTDDPKIPKLIDETILKDRSSVSQSGLIEDTYLYRKLVPLTACDGAAECAILAQLARNALNSTLTGGLAGPLRFDAFIARSFSININLIGTQYVELSAIARPDSNVALNDLEDAFQSNLTRTLETGLTQATFDRIASRLKGEFASILDRDRAQYNKTLVLNQLMSAKPLFTLDQQVDLVKDTQLKDVNNFLKSLLQDGREVARLVRVER